MDFLSPSSKNIQIKSMMEVHIIPYSYVNLMSFFSEIKVKKERKNVKKDAKKDENAIENDDDNDEEKEEENQDEDDSDNELN